MLIRVALIVFLTAALGRDACAQFIADPSGPSPKSVAIAFAKALAAGDGASARALAVGEEKDFAALDTYVQMSKAFNRLRDVARAKYGADAQVIAEQPAGRRPDDLNAAREEISPDTGVALVAAPNDREPLRLRRVGGTWKVDLSLLDARGDWGRATHLFAAMTAAATDTANEVEAGTHKTAADAKIAFGQKLAARLIAATQPSTPPSTQPGK